MGLWNRIGNLIGATVNYFRTPKLEVVGVPRDFEPTLKMIGIQEPTSQTSISYKRIKDLSKRLGLDQKVEPSAEDVMFDDVYQRVVNPSEYQKPSEEEEIELDSLIDAIGYKMEERKALDSLKAIEDAKEKREFYSFIDSAYDNVDSLIDSIRKKEEVIELTEADIEYIDDVAGKKGLNKAQEYVANGNKPTAMATYKNLASNPNRSESVRKEANQAYKTLFTESFGYSEGQILKARELATEGSKYTATSKLKHVADSKYTPAKTVQRANDIRQRLFGN